MTWRYNDMEMLSALVACCEGESTDPSEIPITNKKPCNAQLVFRVC